MHRIILALLATLVFATPASADWRFNIDMPAKVKKSQFDHKCDTSKCHKAAAKRAKMLYWHRFQQKKARKIAQWEKWTAVYIPSCTWYGESGPGPEFRRSRYTTPNASGSDAYGKFQFMPGTYHTYAKYHDWSPLDQELAARKLYWAQGTSPWMAC